MHGAVVVAITGSETVLYFRVIFFYCLRLLITSSVKSKILSFKNKQAQS